MGCVLFGAGILLTGLSMLLFRRPGSPRWARSELVAMLVAVVLTGMIGIGLGYLLFGSYRLLNGAGSPYELAAPVGVTIVVAGLWHVLGIGRRMKAFAATAVPPAAADAATSPGATGWLLPSRPPDGTPPLPARRAA